MGTRSTQRLCKQCDKLVLAQQQTPSHILHLLLTIVMAGVWVMLSFLPRPWLCPNCGSKTMPKRWFYRPKYGSADR